MKRVLGWGMLTVVLLVLSLLVQLPARVILGKVPLPPGVQVVSVEGAWWSGQAQGRLPLGSDLAHVRWQWQPAGLLSGQLRWRAELDYVATDSQLQAWVSRDGWQVEGVMRVPQQQPPAWVQWLPAGAAPDQRRLAYRGVF